MNNKIVSVRKCQCPEFLRFLPLPSEETLLKVRGIKMNLGLIGDENVTHVPGFGWREKGRQQRKLIDAFRCSFQSQQTVRKTTTF
jgi:hypothetical protein